MVADSTVRTEVVDSKARAEEADSTDVLGPFNMTRFKQRESSFITS